jgi:hypothetical protein
LITVTDNKIDTCIVDNVGSAANANYTFEYASRMSISPC